MARISIVFVTLGFAILVLAPKMAVIFVGKFWIAHSHMMRVVRLWLWLNGRLTMLLTRCGYLHSRNRFSSLNQVSPGFHG